MKNHFNKLRFRVPNTTSFLTIGTLGSTISEGFTLNGLGGHLGHVTHKAAKKLSFLHKWGLRTKFGLNWPTVWKMKMFDAVGRRTDAGAWVYSKLTYEPSAHASLKGFSWCICLIHVYSSDWPSTLKDEDV